MNEKEYERAKEAIRKTALLEGMTEEQVQEEIQDAIRQGLENSKRRNDQAALKKWASIECAGEIPTPEEMIAWASKEMKSSNHKTKWFS